MLLTVMRTVESVPSLCNFLHHSFKLFEGDLTVSVIINLVNDFFYFCVHVVIVSKAEHLPNLVSRD